MRSLPASGDIFEGKYRIRERIGQGGYASVFRALDIEIRRDVAIKVLTPGAGEEPYEERTVARFLREGRLISELHDSHTITLLDYGRSAQGLLYMVFEYIDGTTLDELIRRDAPLPPTRVARILLQVLASLTEAHLVGVLHRDIKPGNLMVYDHLGDTDRVKVLDFGIAKPVQGEREVSAELTREGAIIGTPRYMSPEQVIGGDLAPASDIFSVGLVALEMLTGERALPGDDDQAVLRSLLGPEPVPFPDEILIPAPMRALIKKMVAKDLEHRFSSTVAVIDGIHAWLSGRAVDDWSDPQRSRTLERVLTQEVARRSPIGSFGRMELASIVGVFLLGGLSTAAVFRVTDLEERIDRMTSRARPAAETKTMAPTFLLDDLGQREWRVDLSHDAIELRFVGAGGPIQTEDPDKVPYRSREVVEVLVRGEEAPSGKRFVCSMEPSGGTCQVKLKDAEWVRSARDAVPKSWEVVTRIRGKALATANAVEDEQNVPVVKPKGRNGSTRSKVQLVPVDW